MYPMGDKHTMLESVTLAVQDAIMKSFIIAGVGNGLSIFWHKPFLWQFFIYFFLLPVFKFSPFCYLQYAFAIQQGKVFSVRKPLIFN